VSYDGEDGRTHPLVWSREQDGARVLIDTFGHDTRSFDSPSHRELLARSLRWVAGG
jgi:type 1 glutamine amidotransferase